MCTRPNGTKYIHLVTYKATQAVLLGPGEKRAAGLLPSLTCLLMGVPATQRCPFNHRTISLAVLKQKCAGCLTPRKPSLTIRADCCSRPLSGVGGQKTAGTDTASEASETEDEGEVGAPLSGSKPRREPMLYRPLACSTSVIVISLPPQK